MTANELEGLRGEVDYEDMYRMRFKPNVVSINDPNYIHVHGHDRAFNFEPDVIFDLGANVGIFSAYCRRLFPNALIIAVEPDPVNCEEFKRDVNDPKIILIQKAVGNGNQVYKAIGAVNGTGECYLSVGLGYPKNLMDSSTSLQVSSVPSVTIKQLFDEYVREGQKVVVKMDIEGSENFVFNDYHSMELLRSVDYFTVELHYYSLTDKLQEDVNRITREALKSFEPTHTCLTNEIYFYATKKQC